MLGEKKKTKTNQPTETVKQLKKKQTTTTNQHLTFLPCPGQERLVPL